MMVGNNTKAIVKHKLCIYMVSIVAVHVINCRQPNVRYLVVDGFYRSKPQLWCRCGIYQQDQLDGSPIEEIILLLLLYNKGFLNKLTYEQFNNRFLPQVRYLAATELLYVMYIGSVARNRMSKKLERLLSVMLLPIFKPIVPDSLVGCHRRSTLV